MDQELEIGVRGWGVMDWGWGVGGGESAKTFVYLSNCMLAMNLV